MTTPALPERDGLDPDGLDPDEPLPSGAVRKAGRIGVGEPSSLSAFAFWAADFWGVVGLELRVKTSRPLDNMETNLDAPPSLGFEAWALEAIEFVEEEDGSCLLEVLVVGEEGD